MKILSIDAWGNEQDGYDWNAWYQVGTISKEEFEALNGDKDFIQYFIDNLFVKNYPDKFYISDDCLNIVIHDAETHEPLFAIEYGTEY